MYDIIGDIHGHAAELQRLLTKLGYKQSGNDWHHPERKVLFLGDFIDRGPAQVETVAIARSMVERGNALAIMGNHEYNAVAWATPDPRRPHQYLREHSEKNQQQHQEFLDQVGEGSQQHSDILDWFKTLPLFLELEGFRAVHACWHTEHLGNIKPCLDESNRLTEQGWYAVAEEKTKESKALEVLLKGLEVSLPRGLGFHDKAGHVRNEIRTKWWNLEAITYRDLAMVPSSEIGKIPHEPIPGDIIVGYDKAKPVFVGHYWMESEPAPLNEHIACLDYSIAGKGKNRKLCAYRWSGEKVLIRKNFVWVEPWQQ